MRPVKRTAAYDEYGQIRRHLDYRIANGLPMHPWRRLASITELWMTSILLDKVLGDGNTAFEVLTGKSVRAHVQFPHWLSDC